MQWLSCQMARKSTSWFLFPVMRVPRGIIRAGWGPNMEGIRQELRQLEALQGREFTDEELDELEEYAWDIAMEKVEHTIAIWSQRYGAPIEYGTYTECTKEEFEQAVDYL